MPEPTRPQRWASWIAVSSAPQAAEDKISLPHQRATNAEHCARHNGELVAELIVPGESRFIPTWEEACAELPAYAELRRLIEKRSIDVLVYYDRSRLGRMASLAMTIEALCVRAGIALYETTNPPAEISAGYHYERQLVGAIGAVGAQYEVQKLIERGRIGKANRARRGEFVGRPNWGYYYHYDERGARRIEVDQAAAVVVQRLFELYLEGHGTTAVATMLNDLGYRSPTGKPWIKSTVRVILRSAPAYAGYAEANKKSRTGRPLVRGKGTWQPLITEECMQRVEAEIAARAANRRLPQTPYHYSSLCYCSQCGAMMTIQNTQKPHKVFSYVVCARHKPMPTVPIERITAALERKIIDVGAGRVVEEVDPDTLASLQRSLENNARQLVGLRDAYTLADSAYVRGRMDEERYERTVAQLDVQRKALEANRDHLQQAIEAESARGPRHARLVEIAENGLNILHSANAAAANQWLRANFRVWCGQRHVEHIIIY